MVPCQKYNKYRLRIKKWIEADDKRNAICSLSYIPIAEYILKMQTSNNLSHEDAQNIFDVWYAWRNVDVIDENTKLDINEDVCIIKFPRLITLLKDFTKWSTQQFVLNGNKIYGVLNALEYLRGIQKLHNLDDFEICQIFNGRFGAKYELDEHLDINRVPCDPPSKTVYEKVEVSHNSDWVDATYKESGKLITPAYYEGVEQDAEYDSE